MTRETINNEDRGVSLKSVKHVLYDVCLHEDNRALFSKLLERVNKLRDWEEYMAIKKQSSGDLINRQDAIKAIDEKAKRIKNEDTLNGLAGAVGILFDLPSINPQPCEDAVDRQWLMRKATERFYTTNYFNHITKMIEEAPSVNPQKNIVNNGTMNITL